MRQHKLHIKNKRQNISYTLVTFILPCKYYSVSRRTCIPWQPSTHTCTPNPNPWTGVSGREVSKLERCFQIYRVDGRDNVHPTVNSNYAYLHQLGSAPITFHGTVSELTERLAGVHWVSSLLQNMNGSFHRRRRREDIDINLFFFLNRTSNFLSRYWRASHVQINWGTYSAHYVSSLFRTIREIVTGKCTVTYSLYPITIHCSISFVVR